MLKYKVSVVIQGAPVTLCQVVGGMVCCLAKNRVKLSQLKIFGRDGEYFHGNIKFQLQLPICQITNSLSVAFLTVVPIRHDYTALLHTF